MSEHSVKYYLDGVAATRGAVSFSVDSPAVMWGESFFETARIHDGEILGLREHRARMRTSLRLFYRELLLPDVFDHVWESAVEASRGIACGRLRILATPESRDGGRLLYVTTVGPWDAPSRWDYLKGTSACFSAIPHPQTGPAGKSSSAHWARLAEREALMQGYAEAILLRDDKVVESSWATVLAKREEDDVWMTPAAHSGGLKSTTLELLEADGLEVEHRDITRSEILVCDAVVLLSSLRLAIGLARLEYKEFFMPDKEASAMRHRLLGIEL